MKVLTYDSQNFFIDGKKTTILSGAIHYFRIVPEHWKDRLKKLRTVGLTDGMVNITTEALWRQQKSWMKCYHPAVR